jgi:hypothetical protein
MMHLQLFCWVGQFEKEHNDQIEKKRSVLLSNAPRTTEF